MQRTNRPNRWNNAHSARRSTLDANATLKFRERIFQNHYGGAQRTATESSVPKVVSRRQSSMKTTSNFSRVQELPADTNFRLRNQQAPQQSKVKRRSAPPARRPPQPPEVSTKDPLSAILEEPTSAFQQGSRSNYRSHDSDLFEIMEIPQQHAQPPEHDPDVVQKYPFVQRADIKPYNVTFDESLSENDRMGEGQVFYQDEDRMTALTFRELENIKAKHEAEIEQMKTSHAQEQQRLREENESHVISHLEIERMKLAHKEEEQRLREENESYKLELREQQSALKELEDARARSSMELERVKHSHAEEQQRLREENKTHIRTQNVQQSTLKELEDARVKQTVELERLKHAHAEEQNRLREEYEKQKHEVHEERYELKRSTLRELEHAKTEHSLELQRLKQFHMEEQRKLREASESHKIVLYEEHESLKRSSSEKLEHARKIHSHELQRLQNSHLEEKKRLQAQNETQKLALSEEHQSLRSSVTKELENIKISHQREIENLRAENMQLKDQAREIQVKHDGLKKHHSQIRSQMEMHIEHSSSIRDTERKHLEDSKAAMVREHERIQSNLKKEIEVQKQDHHTELQRLLESHKVHQQKLMQENQQVLEATKRAAEKQIIEKVHESMKSHSENQSIWLEFEVNRVKDAYEKELIRVNNACQQEVSRHKQVIEHLKGSKMGLLEDIERVKTMYVEGYKKEVSEHGSLKVKFDGLKAKYESLQMDLKFCQKEKGELNERLLEIKWMKDHEYDIESTLHSLRNERNDLMKTVSELRVENANMNAEVVQLRKFHQELEEAKKREIQNIREANAVVLAEKTDHYKRLLEDSVQQRQSAVEAAAEEVQRLLKEKEDLQRKLDVATSNAHKSKSDILGMEQNLRLKNDEVRKLQETLETELHKAKKASDTAEDIDALKQDHTDKLSHLGMEHNEQLQSLRTFYNIKLREVKSELNITKRRLLKEQRDCEERYATQENKYKLSMKNAKLDWLTDPFWFTKNQFSSQEQLKTRVEKVSAVVQMQQDEIIRHDLSHLMHLKEVENSHEEALRDLNRKFDRLLKEKNEENQALEQKLDSSRGEANMRQEHLSRKLKRMNKKRRVAMHQLGTIRTITRKQSIEALATILSLQNILATEFGKRCNASKSKKILKLTERREVDPFWFVIPDFGVHISSPDGKMRKVKWQGRVEGKKRMTFEEMQQIDDDQEEDQEQSWWNDISLQGIAARDGSGNGDVLEGATSI